MEGGGGGGEGGGKEWAGPVFPHPTIEKEHAVS